MKDALERPAARPLPDLRGAALDYLARRRRLLLGLLAVVVGLALVARGDGADEGSHGASVAAVLAAEGLEVDPGSLVFLGGEQGLLGYRSALFLGRARGAPADLYYADVSTGQGGAVHDVAFVTNLTRTSSAEEQAPVVLGRHVLYASRVGDRFDAVTLLAAEGEPEALTHGWPRRARIQNAITNLQETGRAAGFGRRRYALVESALSLDVRLEGPRFAAQVDGARLVLDPDADAPVEGAELVELRPTGKGIPGTITWVVDTVRNLSFVGPEPIEWLEHRVFGVKDWLERKWYALRGSDAREEAAEAAQDMGVTEAQRRTRLELSATDPEIGWPPASLEPVIRPALAGEGEWVALVDDPFVRAYPNAPTAFYQTYLRADEERGYARVYVVLWDPRQVQLHVMTGTREPESATGETGPGMAPRDPETLERLVGGFNGGFQALHGEFGMMSEGRVYLPPKPWAATVAVHQDGRVSMGSWTDPPPGTRAYEESWAVAQIPEDVVGLRQNLTSVVEDGRYNPWERWWWGAAPQDADEQTFIDRTGLCLTREGFLAYFYGTSLGPEQLGHAMLAARCARGMHLDMNSRHTGFELYDVRRAGAHPPLGRALTDAEHEGPVPFAEGFTVRARKLVRRMTPMRFPRYVGRDGRDFFYLTQRPVLPGPHLAASGDADGAGRFETAGLPHAGWPHAFARAFLGGEAAARTWVVRIDPRRAMPPSIAPPGAARPLAYLTGAAGLARPDAPAGLWSAPLPVGRRFGVGAPPREAQVLVAGELLSESSEAQAAIGVDGDGFLVYAERRAGDVVPLSRRLSEAGVSAAVALGEGVRLAFAIDGATVGPDAFERAVEQSTALPLLAEERPQASVLFPETEPRPYARWRRLQDARVRYTREAPPTFSRQGGGLRDPDAGVR